MEAVGKSEKPIIWEYLVPDDLAESLLERAESFSKKGKSEESMRAFREAAELFGAIESFLDVRDWEVEDQAERMLIHRMRDAARLKMEYCLARINQEAEKLRMEGDGASENRSRQNP